MTITSMLKETKGKTYKMNEKIENFSGELDLKKNQAGILILSNMVSEIKNTWINSRRQDWQIQTQFNRK